MTAQQIIEKARKLISDPDSFTTDFFARDPHGIAVSVSDEDATQFCTVGALHRVSGVSVDKSKGDYPFDLIQARAIMRDQARRMGYVTVINLNDRGGHDKVMDLFDRTLTEMKGGKVASVGGSTEPHIGS